MSGTGSVTLVGAGPGDPGLLTLAGKAALETAEVVLYDRLVSREILALIPAAALAVDVGKNKGDHPVPQDEINRLILRHAGDGKRVVRLKGGDPYLFGRGAEELEGVVAAGLPFRVVPGVTSALAAPAYAGIPVTHRDHASSVHILTGHGKGGSEPKIPYESLAGLGGTLVFLMGLTALDDIAANLTAAGMAADTPAALVENGARPEQRRVVATLADIAARARQERVRSPAVLVVGDVCALAERYDWTVGLPLWGRRVLAVSSSATSGRLARNLRNFGCGVDEFCGILTKPLPPPDQLWTNLPAYEWIVFTSATGVHLFFDQLFERGLDVRRFAAARFAVVGTRTAAALRERGVVADYVPATFDGDSLARGLSERTTSGRRTLLFRAREGTDVLSRVLAESGAVVDDVAAYDTVTRKPDADIARCLAAGGYDAMAFSSASGVRALRRAAEAASLDWSTLAATPAACIGESTAEAARACGFAVTVADVAALDSLADAVVGLLGKTK